MIIRKATPTDRATIVEMAIEFLNDSVYSAVIRIDAAHMTQLVDLVIGEGHGTTHVVFLAETADGVAGFLALLKLAHPMNGDLYAEELAWWVDPDWRGSSAAGRLLRAGENWAREQGLRVIKMGAPVGSPVGGHYERLGYSPLEVTYTKKL